jgi:hypothetical protein
MRREFSRWYSHRLHRDMDVVVYGHYGTPLLMFPTAGADFLEYGLHRSLKLAKSRFSLSIASTGKPGFPIGAADAKKVCVTRRISIM